MDLIQKAPAAKIKQPKKLKRKGTDPVLDETYLQNKLNLTFSVETALELQEAAAYSILAAFDRKIERVPFIEIVNASMILHSLVARWTTLNLMMKLTEENPKADIKVSQKMLAHVQQSIETHQTRLYDMINLLVECPKEKDNIN